MSIKDGKDYLLLIWKEPNKRRNYVVGELSKNGQFEFSYGYEVQQAIEDGFELLISFPDINKVYKSEQLFSVFASRLPDPKRKGIEAILKKYSLTEYNAYELLKNSGARLPIDKLEFIDPIFDFDSGEIVRSFFLAGPRYYLGCNGEECEKSIDVTPQEEIRCVLEPENVYDKNAIKILNTKDILLGYLPRYYAEGISKLINNEETIICRVIEINRDTKCNECIKVELTINKKEDVGLKGIC